jgi:hypothetical protein
MSMTPNVQQLRLKLVTQIVRTLTIDGKPILPADYELQTRHVKLVMHTHPSVYPTELASVITGDLIADMSTRNALQETWDWMMDQANRRSA